MSCPLVMGLQGTIIYVNTPEGIIQLNEGSGNPYNKNTPETKDSLKKYDSWFLKVKT